MAVKLTRAEVDVTIGTDILVDEANKIFAEAEVKAAEILFWFMAGKRKAPTKEEPVKGEKR